MNSPAVASAFAVLKVCAVSTALTVLAACAPVVQVHHDPDFNPSNLDADWAFPHDFHPKLAVCMSGGGYRAALFQLGVLWRLNELGVLRHAELFASVSGGSILNAQLGQHWRDLTWGTGPRDTDVATNFKAIVAVPLLEATGHTIDVGATLTGLLPGTSASTRVAASYDRYLFHGARLADMPRTRGAPNFVFLTSVLDIGVPMYMSSWGLTPDLKDQAGSGLLWDSHFAPGDISTAQVVAASSGYPPFLAPMLVDLSQVAYHPPAVQDRGLPEGQAAFVAGQTRKWREVAEKRLAIADGGLVDNTAVDACIHAQAAIIQINAGTTPEPPTTPPGNWLSVLTGSVETMFEAKERAIQHRLESWAGHGIGECGSRHFYAIDLGRSRALEAVGFFPEALGRRQGKLDTWATTAGAGAPAMPWITSARRSLEEASKADAAVAPPSFDDLRKVAVSTRLAALSDDERKSLVNFGYLMAEYAMELTDSSTCEMATRAAEGHGPMSWIPHLYQAPMALPIQ